MKVTELRIGNIISPEYDPEKYGVVMAIDQCGTVHLSNRDYPDEIRDIVGIELTEILLAKFGLRTCMCFQEREISIQFNGKRVVVTIDDCTSYEIRFVHQLQNLIFVNTSHELIDTIELLQY